MAERTIVLIQGYTPVVAFKRNSDASSISGYAAGAEDAPCLIKLMAGETPIAFARATRYSDTAATDGFRAGWCGFDMPGIQQAFAVSDSVTLRCAVSDGLLVELSAEDASGAKGDGAVLTVEDLLSHARSADLCPSIDLLAPFALNHFHRHGQRQLVEATYETLLMRWPDSSAREPSVRIADDEKRVIAYLRDVMKSDEYAYRWGRELPGPFHPAFRYDRVGVI